jgi:hypothetical protein
MITRGRRCADARAPRLKIKFTIRGVIDESHRASDGRDMTTYAVAHMQAVDVLS